MQIVITEWFGLLFVLLLLALAIFPVVYFAVRMAILDSPALPKFSCYTEIDGATTRLTVSNTGTGPAFDLAVRWVQAGAYGEPLAQTPILLPQASFTCELGSAPGGTAEPGAPSLIPTVGWLAIAFRPNPTMGSRATRVPVRLAGRFGAP